MIIFDNHLHLRRDGRYLEAVKEFRDSGGTHFVLCQYPMPQMVIQHKSYLPCYRETLQMAEEIRKELSVGVFVTVGPYPVDYIRLREHFSRDEVIELMKQGMDEAARLCQEQLCVGIGEIGRPHFPVDQQILEDSDVILRYGMEKAKEVGVPVVLHTESTTPHQCLLLASMARSVGLPPDRVVKHFAPPLIFPEENHGLMPSVLASKKNVVAAIEKGFRFLLETDYIDDPRRPGAVLGPKTIPKITRLLLDEGKLSNEQVFRIHVENPEQVYGISLSE